MKVTGNTAHVQAKINSNSSEESAYLFELVTALDEAGYNDRQKFSLLLLALTDDDVRKELNKIIKSKTQSKAYPPLKKNDPVSRAYVSRMFDDFSGELVNMFEHYVERIETQISQIEVVAGQSIELQEAFIQDELNATEKRLREQLTNRRGGSARDRRK